MTDVQSRPSVFHLANRMRIELFHFASGTYSDASHLYNARPINRLFLVTENSIADASLLEDCNGIMPLEMGHAYLVPAFHSSRWILTENLHFISIHFKAECISGLDLFSTSKRIYPAGDATLIAAAKSIWTQSNEYVAAAQLNSLCFQVCSELFQRFSIFEFDVVTRFENFRSVVEYVEQKGSAETTVAELAELMKMRTDLFSRKFTHETGLTPKLFLNRSLTRKAGELLERGKSNREAATKLRFNNEFYFSRFFKKMTGVTPGDYRKKR